MSQQYAKNKFVTQEVRIQKSETRITTTELSRLSPELSILAIVVAIVIVVVSNPFPITALLIAIAITNTINTISYTMNLTG